MGIVEIIGIGILLLTIILGGFGLIAPRWTMKLLNLAPEGGKQGFSEVRAVNGSMFIGLGLAGLLLPAPAAATVGFGYVAAACGRLVSIALDGSGTGMIWRFALFEALFGIGLIAWQWEAVTGVLSAA